MNTITPTYLRKNLFEELSAVVRGMPVRIKTKAGNAIILPEKEFKLSNSKSVSKIKGKIIGNLEDADQELRKYIQLQVFK